MSIKIDFTSRDVMSVTADAVLLFMFREEKRPVVGDRALSRRLERDLARRKFRGDAGRTASLSLEEGRRRKEIIVCGLGPKEKLSQEELLTSVAAGVRSAAELGAAVVATGLPGGDAGGLEDDDRTRLTVQAARLALYRFDRYLSNGSSRPSVERLVLAGTGGAKAKRGVLRGSAVSEGIALARDLVNEPAAAINPTTMVREARKVARASGLKIKVLGPREIERQKMGALLAVAVGSDVPAQVIHLTYTPPGRAKGKIALVGKGVTFDSGGYNLKGSAHILDMKCDMAGSAAVLGAMQAVARLKPRVEVHGLMGMVENLVSGRAYKPGDVLRTRRGKTVEINNTDAEGRLVLADLLDYACTKIRPDAVVDLATLTGACVVALGPSATGLMSNDADLAERVSGAARRSGEKMWQLPLYDEYRDQLKSDIADLKNTGTRYGGALTAGLFLSEFVRDGVPWVHLDIAGPSFYESPHAYWGKGGTGAGVATLVELVETWG